jgi:cellulose biosynthesis protein BcsQ
MNEFSDQKRVHEGIFSKIESSFEIPVLESKINSRVAYAEVSIIGKGVYEYSDTKAKKEIINLAHEILSEAKKLELME